MGRDKIFGLGRPRPLDREAKLRVMMQARALSRRTQKGKHYGAVTAKTLAVLQALLWRFHNARSGVCFPSLETIAEAAGCARSTVAAAIKVLERLGLLSWVNRLKRVREYGVTGWRWRVLRTSNGYTFIDPRWSANSSKSEIWIGTETQAHSYEKAATQSELPLAALSEPINEALRRLERSVFGGNA